MIIGSTESVIHSNLLFILADMMEICLSDVRQLLKKEGCDLKHETRREFNTAIHSAKKLRSELNKCMKITQDSFGNDSDHMYEFIKLLIDRCGSDEKKMLSFYEYVEAKPSQCKLRCLDKSVFDSIEIDEDVEYNRVIRAFEKYYSISELELTERFKGYCRHKAICCRLLTDLNFDDKSIAKRMKCSLSTVKRRQNAFISLYKSHGFDKEYEKLCNTYYELCKDE